jgi:deoxyribodipyrimidine photo-lyase
MESLKDSNHVIPIFIFTPEQIKNNKYKSQRCINFMIESLVDLESEIKIYFFYGSYNKIINNLIKKLEIDAIYLNQDYTPYSIKRDENVKKICEINNIKFKSYEDILLNPVSSVKTDNNQVYQKFTPYYMKARTKKINKPTKNKLKNYYTKNISGTVSNIKKFYDKNLDNNIIGGRKHGLNILKNIKDFQDYNKNRNNLTYDTTHLSAYNKFGCVSIREVYYYFKKNKNSDLVKQLYWRDFYYNIVYENPDVLKQKNYNNKYNKIRYIKWSSATDKQKDLFNKWCAGKTGYPVVDAGMRELNNTGFMHNRARLITASFLTKLMFWSWTDGERYFAKNLVDYDPSQNNGNWQWCSGSGVDAQPYYRIFNPWMQSEKHDPDCEYIKKWIPELNDVDNNHIHKWYDYHDQYDVYYEPMIDYEESRESCINKLKKLNK